MFLSGEGEGDWATSCPGPFPNLECGAPRTQDREKALGTRLGLGKGVINIVAI